MTTMTEKQLREIQWKHVTSECVHDHIEPAITHDDELGEYQVASAVSEAYGISELRGTAPDGTELTLMVNWATSGNTQGTFADLYDWDMPERDDVAWDFSVQIEQYIEVQDDDGDALDKYELARLLNDIAEDAEDVWQAPARETLPTCPDPEDIDIDEDSDMATFTLDINNRPLLRFSGEKIAEVSSTPNNALRGYSGQTGRWTTLALYRTVGGKFVCHQIGHTQWQGEVTRYSGAVCDDHDGVIDFFGHGWLAKELYEEASIADVQDID